MASRVDQIELAKLAEKAERYRRSVCEVYQRTTSIFIQISGYVDCHETGSGAK